MSAISRNRPPHRVQAKTSSESQRRADWTFAVAITYKDTAAMVVPSGEEEIAKRLYPDQATFRKEERRRFEILDAHWDVPLSEL